MENFLNFEDRTEITNRIKEMSLDSKRKWGTMNQVEMMCHVKGQLEVALGMIPTKPTNNFLFSSWVGKKLILYVVPWRKGKEASPKEIIQDKKEQSVTMFQKNKQELIELINQFLETEEQQLSQHPFFGKMSKKDWGRLTWKHLNHHLQQFGL